MATEQHRTSTGHLFSEGGWLDAHFESCRPEYEAALQSSGLEPGWHVLDAGCGSGSYLPAMAGATGVEGRITALDLAPENVDLVQRRLAGEWSFSTPVEAVQGSVLGLPFDDSTFDAVWCANVQEYLPDGDLLVMLGEFRRVTRPGGLVIVKDADPMHFILQPAPYGFIQHHFEAGYRRPVWTPARGAIRIWDLKRFIERAGLKFQWQRSSLIERRAPLRPVERAYLGNYLSTHAGLALENNISQLSDEDIELWRALRDPNGENHPLDHPDLYWCECQAVALARVPDAG